MVGYLCHYHSLVFLRDSIESEFNPMKYIRRGKVQW